MLGIVGGSRLSFVSIIKFQSAGERAVGEVAKSKNRIWSAVRQGGIVTSVGNASSECPQWG